ncbi:MAG: ABC transporter permease [Alphaproteobacteria bacterium]|nr:ABC transporter permease [Alphaproteobacteria bacterium]
MFRNYLTVALRSAHRNKLYTFITIAGLTVALACAIFILLFIADELSYDRFIPDMGNVYRVDLAFYVPGRMVERGDNNMFVLGSTMKAEIPQVVAQTRIANPTVTLEVGNRLFSQDVDVVDPDFFQVIHLPLEAGDPSRVFSQPDSIVLSQSEARKLFGTTHAVGKTVLVDGTHPMLVTGILVDLPHNSQLKASVLFPNTSKADPMTAFYKRHWLSTGPMIYVRLAPGSDLQHVTAMVRRILDSHIDLKKDFGVDLPASRVFRPHLTAFWQGHLSEYGGGMTPGGSWLEIYGFGVIAAMILLIAGFNFTNLATAQAAMRAREVSLRKVLGASRWQLIRQFLGESLLMAAVSLVLALAIVELLTPAYDGFMGRPITFQYFADWPLSLIVLGAALLTGLLGGIYPAFVLSAFRPAAMLRGNTGAYSGSGLLRSALVILQFSVSIGLGIAAIVVYAQIRYAHDVNLGFDRSHILVVNNLLDIPAAKRRDFARAVAASPSVSGTTLSRNAPFDGEINTDSFTVPGSPQMLDVRAWEADPNYPKIYHLKLLAGRFLSFARAQDKWKHGAKLPTNVLVSQAAARLFGFTPQQAIGKTIKEGSHSETIVGVVTNQLLDGPQAQPMPVVFVYDHQMHELSARIKPGQTEAAVRAIDRIWHRFAPNSAINSHFLDERFDRLFKADVQRGRMFAAFVGIAIFVACLGLYGLAAFAAQRRTKEIGVRKVFGARTVDIVRMLLWQFSIPVLLANIIAWPVSWYYLRGWLDGFAERVWLNPAYFVGAGLVALLIAWATVIAHARRAARSSPVKALRYE